MTRVRAVLLDALGTLVELQPPAPRLRSILLDATGVDIGSAAAECEQGLERLRDDCAERMRAAIGRAELDHATVRRAMLAALQFAPYPDAAPALAELRRRGLKLVVASNWDYSLPRWLDRAGLWELLDGAASSAVVGEPKPSPAVFRAALELAGAAPHEALHVGDSPANDVEGARAAGVRAVLVDRAGRAHEGVEVVTSLEELPSLL